MTLIVIATEPTRHNQSHITKIERCSNTHNSQCCHSAATDNGARWVIKDDSRLVHCCGWEGREVCPFSNKHCINFTYEVNPFKMS